MIKIAKICLLGLLLTANLSVVEAQFWKSRKLYEGRINLGATLPLSGDYATYGRLIQDGVELALDELRAEGYDVSVYYQEVNTPGPQAVNAINHLVTAEHINALVANFWNPAIPIMAPTLIHEKIPSFHTAAADDHILNAGDYIFSTNSRISDEAKKVAVYAFKNMGARRVSVLYIGTNFGENYARYFIDTFRHLGGTIVSEDMTALGATDLRTVMLRVKSKNPDLIYAAYFGTNLGLVIKQARQQGLTQTVLSDYEAEDPSVIETAGEHASGLKFFISQPTAYPADVQPILRNYIAKYGYEPRILGQNAYDATKIMVYALAACKLAPECTKDLLYTVRDYEGLSGKFSIDRDGAASKSFVLKEVVEGKYKAITY